jgi:hypothetical protein
MMRQNARMREALPLQSTSRLPWRPLAFLVGPHLALTAGMRYR